MSKKKTKEEFIAEAKLMHPNENLDYSQVVYINNRTNVWIIDHDKKPDGTEYGGYWQSPSNHLKGQGHPEKKGLKISNKMKNDSKIIFNKIKIAHPDINFDFFKSVYNGIHVPMTIYDKTKDVYGNEFGEYSIDVSYVIKGGIPSERKKLLFADQFIRKSIIKYDGKYLYNINTYIDELTPMQMFCPIHGEFWETPKKHLKSSSGECKLCIGKFDTFFIKDGNDFLNRFKKIYNNRYDTSFVKYVHAFSKIKLICPVHGEFWETPFKLLKGYSCPKCTGKIDCLGDFVFKAIQVHGNKYDYSKVDYVDSKTPVCIICPEHGEFLQTPSGHLFGYGCDKCSNHKSDGEEKIGKYIISLIGKNCVQFRVKNILSNKKQELDIFIPSLNVAFEYDGLYYHSAACNKDKNYHLNKTEQCKEKGIRLIHIFEDEYLEHPEIVLNKIKHILNKDDMLECIGARKCVIKEITYDISKNFLDVYHIQGGVYSSIYLGAYYKDELVAVMTFKKDNIGNWELNRFATNTTYRLPGIASKLFRYFINIFKPLEIKSFLDRRWNIEGDTMYEKLGFVLDCITPPDYSYVKNAKRFHKFGFRKQILHKKYALPLSMTESEMTEQLGYSKIYNCGLAKYIWRAS